MLIEGHKSLSSKQQATPRTSSLKVSSHLSYAEVVRGEAGNPKGSDLKGSRCRNCGSWDVCGAIIGQILGRT